MFKKVLIANRGEIAVRIVRACRDMGIRSVALYDASDLGSLHVRLADECVRLTSERGYLDQDEIIQRARETGAEAIHPGYGFLAEQPDFIRACAAAGLAFIGPAAEVVELLRNKIATLRRARSAGFNTPRHSDTSFGEGDRAQLRAAARQIGYPLVIKSCRGGRGRGTRVVRAPAQLDEAVRRARDGSAALFGDKHIYLEQAILPSRYLEVQVLGDQHGHLIHLGERDSSIQLNNQKIVAEAPAPYLSPAQRERLWRAAVEIARLFGCSGACVIEFVIDLAGELYFTEIKPRIQVEHPVTEMLTSVDIVREQIRAAAGEPLSPTQAAVALDGCAMQCRINAEDPWNHFLPSPGRIDAFRLPGGPHVRVDTYAYRGCELPLRYDPIFAKLIVWGEDRRTCLSSMRGALEECFIGGIQTNLPLLQRVFDDPDFIRGEYTTEFNRHPLKRSLTSAIDLRDLAVAAAVAYAVRAEATQPSLPERLLSGWHRDSRRLPN